MLEVSVPPPCYSREKNWRYIFSRPKRRKAHYNQSTGAHKQMARISREKKYFIHTPTIEKKKKTHFALSLLVLAGSVAKAGEDCGDRLCVVQPAREDYFVTFFVLLLPPLPRRFTRHNRHKKVAADKPWSIRGTATGTRAATHPPTGTEMSRKEGGGHAVGCRPHRWTLREAVKMSCCFQKSWQRRTRCVCNSN